MILNSYIAQTSSGISIIPERRAAPAAASNAMARGFAFKHAAGLVRSCLAISSRDAVGAGRTKIAESEILSCGSCGHREERAATRSKTADPRQCQECNP
jgi:hypothetical protein